MYENYMQKVLSIESQFLTIPNYMEKVFSVKSPAYLLSYEDMNMKIISEKS